MKVFQSINTMYSERSAVVLYILVFKIRNLSILLSSIKHNERVPFNIITSSPSLSLNAIRKVHIGPGASIFALIESRSFLGQFVLVATLKVLIELMRQAF